MVSPRTVNRPRADLRTVSHFRGQRDTVSRPHPVAQPHPSGYAQTAYGDQPGAAYPPQQTAYAPDARPAMGTAEFGSPQGPGAPGGTRMSGAVSLIAALTLLAALIVAAAAFLPWGVSEAEGIE